MSDRPMLARQSGSAMFYSFIMTLVLFLAATYFAYAIFLANEEMRADKLAWTQEKQDLEGKNRILRDYVEEISASVGETGEYTGKEGFNYDDYGNPDPVQNATLPSRYEATIGEAMANVGLPRTTELSQAMTLVQNRVNELNKQKADRDETIQTLETRVAKLQEDNSKLSGQLQQRERELNQQLTEQSERYEGKLADADQRQSTLSNNIRDVRAQVAEARQQSVDLELERTKQIRDLQAQLNALQSRAALVNAPEEADGLVISANQAIGRCFVDIGRFDMLKAGTKFYFHDPITGKRKATGEVTRLEDRRAEMRVFDLADRLDPVVRGDEIRNDLYSPGLKRTIFLMGRFAPPYSEPIVRSYLTRLGNKVVDRVDIGVDLVIVGNDPINEDASGTTSITESPDYKRASELQIDFVNLYQIRDLLEADTTASLR